MNSTTWSTCISTWFDPSTELLLKREQLHDHCIIIEVLAIVSGRTSLHVSWKDSQHQSASFLLSQQQLLFHSSPKLCDQETRRSLLIIQRLWTKVDLHDARPILFHYLSFLFQESTSLHCKPLLWLQKNYKSVLVHCTVYSHEELDQYSLNTFMETFKESRWCGPKHECPSLAKHLDQTLKRHWNRWKCSVQVNSQRQSLQVSPHQDLKSR